LHVFQNISIFATPFGSVTYKVTGYSCMANMLLSVLYKGNKGRMN